MKIGKNAGCFSFVFGLLLTGNVFGAPSVKIERVTQRWPWNNKVDITYSITDGQDVTQAKYYRLVFKASIDGTEHVIDGVHDVGASAATGTHTVTWTAPSGIKTDDFSVSAEMYTASVPSGNDYMIVDLASGEITYEGLLATQEASNARYNTHDDDGTCLYKGDKLVLRKIAAGGSYPTGHTTYNTRNSPKTWKTDRDYYISIFAVTCTQYTNLIAKCPCLYATQDLPDSPRIYRPVQNVSWNELRTEIEPSESIPSVSEAGTGTFFQRLNYLTGNKFGFDLPTEVMSEIVEHAGTTTYYPWGDNNDGCADYAVIRRDLESGQQTYQLPVGSRLPNAWGFYDLIGNAREWLLDDATRSNLAEAPDPWTPADGTETEAGYDRCMYSNYFVSNQGYSDNFRLANRSKSSTGAMAPSELRTKKDWTYGFRVAYIVK